MSLAERNAEALVLIQSCLNDTRISSHQVLDRTRELRPSGPEYFSEVLGMIIKNPLPWAGSSDPRDRMLHALVDAVKMEEAQEIWPHIRGTSLSRKIRRQMHELLKFARNSSPRQQTIISLYNSLDMWDEMELEFLMRASRNRGGHLALELAKVLQNADEETKRAAVRDARGTRNFPVLSSFLEYQILEPSDYEHLLLLRLHGSPYKAFDVSDSMETQESPWSLANRRTDRGFVRLLRNKDRQFLRLFKIYRSGAPKSRDPSEVPARAAYMESLWSHAYQRFPLKKDAVISRNSECQSKMK